ncbi:hypothetical protein AA313_de0201713 [Arthrobotrys entomopaga]|nr:hypothetical protein AA313_de0201713 [Arthrobotrys entomopaga]
MLALTLLKDRFVRMTDSEPVIANVNGENDNKPEHTNSSDIEPKPHAQVVDKSELLPQAPSELEITSSSEEIFEVRKIVGEKQDRKTGETLYRVRWKGFTKDNDTWEPIENLNGCEDALAKWEQKKIANLKPQPVKKRGPGRPPRNPDALSISNSKKVVK